MLLGHRVQQQLDGEERDGVQQLQLDRIEQLEAEKSVQIQELQIQRHEAELVRLHWEEEPWLHDESVELVEVDPERPVQKLEELGFHHHRLSVE